ncbi:Stk1 family PASTA domain-containing Ser/Thr kinase [Rhodococcus sp. MEB064]|uniref:Stk1 family PASTA domain-containing Ser/Thr kinase n=1 Tax=Rhodococcus sp. MEB064 TaxID=1587522 RepID=UPI0005ACE99D|nr:Stk1 family PASTA domain-containing Ser/Thr kinase [Rhodococcus sp. MEB064]KIQ16190.1 protein kinase [Rhodococcus sp. MEB064]
MTTSGRSLLGALLDRRYRVDAPIARGGMSTVYRGLDLRLDRPVAIKIMDPQFAADPEFVRRFEFEARAVARLSHPGLVAVYDHGRDGEHAFLVMELVEGGTLRELLRERGPMPPHAAVAVLQPVLDGLAVAHRGGLVHRDVKPENVLISDSGEVKIADFGLVRAVAAATTTSNSVILGTAAYLSPEQVTVGAGDARSDVYSAGILLFEVLTGRTPFQGDTSLSIAYQRIENDVPAPSSVISGIPPHLDALVRDATQRRPDDRFRDAAVMGDAMRSVTRMLGLPQYRVPSPSRSAEHLSAETVDAPRPYAPQAPRTPETEIVSVPAESMGHAPPSSGVQHTRMVTTATARGGEDERRATAAEPVDKRAFAFPDFDADKRRSRRLALVWLAIVVVVAVLLGTVGWWAGSGRFTAVPSIEGLDRSAAISAIESADLSVTTEGRYTDSDPVDRLLGTEPAPGSRIAKGETVTLLVSQGRPSVPTLAGSSAAAAVDAALRERTFVPVDGGEAFSSTAPVGDIAALDPAPGTVLPVGSEVRVLTSKGAPPVDIPDVAGSTEADARAELDRVGIVVGSVEKVFDADVDGGKVIGTNPGGGDTVTAGSSVALQVSTAVTLPSLLGRTVGSARAELERLGLTVVVRQLATTDRSLVITQNPGQGDRVEPNSTVTLVSLP